MGLAKNGNFGGISGKVGNAISYELNGQQVVRTVGERPKKKPTQKEKVNRDRFAKLQAWLQPLLPFLRVGFKNYAPTFQGFVAAKSYNAGRVFSQQTNGESIIDPSLAFVSHGSLTRPQNMALLHEGNNIVVTWGQSGHYDGHDVVMVVAYIPNTGLVLGDTSIAKRYMGRAVVPIEYAKAGDEIHVYLAFVAYDQTAQSNSQYLGMITVA